VPIRQNREAHRFFLALGEDHRSNTDRLGAIISVQYDDRSAGCIQRIMLRVVLMIPSRYVSGYINTLIAFFSSHRRKADCQSARGSLVEIRSFNLTRPSA
jgi:hypothetical protein